MGKGGRCETAVSLARTATPSKIRPVREYEDKARSTWQKAGLHMPALKTAQNPYYNLMMFPYPSAEGLHVGNMYAFTGADIHGRFQAMNGYDVFEPMGFDAFGIHSENYAIKINENPRTLTARNVKRFSGQLEQIGARFSWEASVDTTQPEYYRWTQWLFLQLYKAGLAVKKKAAVNWCPQDATVLADEQVIGGNCERCNTPVEQRELEQWFFTITKYADRLLNNLDTLDWSDVVKSAQRNWIGRSQGLELSFNVNNHPDVSISVFTTRPDTVFGATFLVLAPEHPAVAGLTKSEHQATVAAYVAQASFEKDLARITRTEKSGVFTGAYATNPISGVSIPIWVADYVLASYGSGAIMAVPAHDERDFAFATAFNLPITPVIEYPSGGPLPYIGEGKLINSGEFNGTTSIDARERISNWFVNHQQGRPRTQFRLRDWLVSRQRYWGPPIPIIYCQDCGIVPVPEDQLPVLLPDLENWLPSATGTSPLGRLPSFVNTTCPTCNKPATRDTDVSDNFLDSAWYFLAYLQGDKTDVPFDPELVKKWFPINAYIGGAEHSVLHLLYARFITMALHDLGHLPSEEPFTVFRAHGHLRKDGEKMAKSKGNVVNPDEYIEKYGADTLRLVLMFAGPYEQGGDFSDKSVVGIERFLDRVWQITMRCIAAGTSTTRPVGTQAQAHQQKAIERVRTRTASLRYNTAIAALMEYINFLETTPEATKEEVRTLLLLLAPYAPHMTEELWQKLGEPFSIHQQPFPVSTGSADESVSVAVQVNSKVRATVSLAPDASEEVAQEAATNHPDVAVHLKDRTVRKFIYVPGKIINFVV